jgi:hypothetical protein
MIIHRLVNIKAVAHRWMEAPLWFDDSVLYPGTVRVW